MLIPNNKQNTRMFGTVGACRFAYNWTIAKEQEAYEKNKLFIKESDIRKQFTKLKKTEEFKWLYNYSNESLKQAIIDACNAYERFFNNLSNLPKFKKKGRCKESFYIDTGKFQIKDGFVKLEKLTLSNKKNKLKFNWVRLAEKDRIPIGVKYYNPRVTFDGLNWWLTVSTEEVVVVNNSCSYSEGIGIDLGIKDLIICSNGNKYKNINKSKYFNKVENKVKSIQKLISKKYESNIINTNKKGWKKTKNIKKLETKCLKLNRRLVNIRTNYLHKVINNIINQKPRFINIENLSSKEMMQNHDLAKMINDVSFYTIRDMLSYKCKRKGIELRLIDKWYPSSKKCSRCGNVKKELSLNTRIYKCECCNLIIDRDYNASINILNYKF